MTTPTTSAQHTPGPWTVHDWASDLRVQGANGETVVILRTQTGDGYQQYLANARLIAAAPALLAALKRAERSLQALGAGKPWTAVETRAAAEEARAAIHAAKGK